MHAQCAGSRARVRTHLLDAPPPSALLPAGTSGSPPARPHGRSPVVLCGSPPPPPPPSPQCGRLRRCRHPPLPCAGSGPARPREAAAPAPSASPGGSVSAAACGEGGPGSPRPPRLSASAARPPSYPTFPPRPGGDGAASHLLLLRNFSRLYPPPPLRGAAPGRPARRGAERWGRALSVAGHRGLSWGPGVPAAVLGLSASLG